MLCPFHTWLDVIISWLLISDHPRANNKCFPRFPSHIVPTPMQGPHSMSSGSLTEHAWGQGKESAKGMSNQTSCEWHHSDLWMGIICFLSEKLGGIFNLRASWSQSQFCFPQIFFFKSKLPSPQRNRISELFVWLLAVGVVSFWTWWNQISHSYPGFVLSFCLIPSALPPGGCTVKVGPLCLSTHVIKDMAARWSRVFVSYSMPRIYPSLATLCSRHDFLTSDIFFLLTCPTHSESQSSSLSPMYFNGAVFCFYLVSITWHSTWIQLVWTFYP